jgi:pre-mRNA-splicing factor ATP-dependent RNA helicase DHX16
VEIDYEDQSISEVSDDTYSNVRKSFTSGYFYNVAKLQKNGNYRTVKNPHSVNIHPSSCLFEDTSEWVVFYELVFTTKEYMRNVMEIDPKWLIDIAPHYYK